MPHRVVKISKELLKELYIDRKLSSVQIAKRFNCSKSMILSRLYKYDIPIRRTKLKIKVTKNKLRHLYTNRGLSIHKISKVLNISPTTAYKRLIECGISLRNISEALKGRRPWNKGKHLSGATKRKLSKVFREIWTNPEYREKMEVRNRELSRRMKGDGNPMKELEVRMKVSKKMIGKLVGGKNPAKNLRTRRKISKALRGHIFSQKTKDKISQTLAGKYIGKNNPFYGKHHTESVKENSRMRAIKQLISGELKNKETTIERRIEEELIKKSIYYKKQYPLENITVADFYLPRYKIVIYCDGAFWHKSRWAQRQGVIKKDKRQNRFLTNSGYKVFRFSETKINNSSQKCVDKIIKYIKKFKV